MNPLKFYSVMTVWQKRILLIVIVLIFLLIVYIIIKSSKRETEEKNIKTDKNKFLSQGQKATYPLTNYNLFADKIYSAGLSTFGTSEQDIYDVFEKMNTDLDVIMLIEAFGKRRLEFYVCIPFTECGENLGAFLQSELDPDENEKINKILADKNIEYRF